MSKQEYDWAPPTFQFTANEIVDIFSSISPVCIGHQITPDQLIGRQRNKVLNEERDIVLYLVWKLTDATRDTIGKFFSNRSHTTIYNSLTNAFDSMSSDDIFTTYIRD